MPTRRKSQSKSRKNRISKQPFKPFVFRSHSTPASRPHFLPQPHLKLRMKDNLTHGHWNMREVLKHHPEET